MQIKISVRHLELTPGLKAYAQTRLRKVERYFDRIVDLMLILTKEKRRELAEVVVYSSPGEVFRAKAEAESVYAAIDKVMDKVKEHFRRYKEKIKLKRNRRRVKISIPLQREAEKEGEIVEKKTMKLRKISVEEALKEMKTSQEDFLIFSNLSQTKIYLLQRLEEESYRLLEMKI